MNPFCEAAAAGNLEEIDKLLADGFTDVAADNNNALRLAAKEGHLDVVNRLLEFQDVIQNINIQDNEALHLAANNGHLKLVNRLLEFDAVRKNIDANNNLLYFSAACSGHVELVNQLLKFDAVVQNMTINNNIAFCMSAKDGNLEMVKLLLEYDAVVQKVNAHDNLALYWAADQNHLEILNILLEYDAVIQNITIHDNRALRAAAAKGHQAITNRLLQFDAVRRHNSFEDLCNQYPIIRTESELVCNQRKNILTLLTSWHANDGCHSVLPLEIFYHIGSYLSGLHTFDVIQNMGRTRTIDILNDQAYKLHFQRLKNSENGNDLLITLGKRIIDNDGNNPSKRSKPN